MYLGQDLRFGLRSLRRDWIVNAVAILSLAAALAGNTTVFSLVNAVLYRPLPYPEPERLVLVGEREANAPQTLTVSPANFADLRNRNRAFGEMAGFVPTSVAIGRGDRPVAVAGARVSPAFFSILGAPILQGRAFEAAEGEVGRDDVVIVTDDFLANQMPELEDPIGAEVFAGGRTRTIVGVLPEDFDFFIPNLKVWLPLTLDPADLPRDQRTLFIVGRLQPGVSMEQAREDMLAIWDRLVLEYPETNTGYVLDVLNFRNEIPNTQARALFALLQGAVFFVLLIACVNIANLMSARGHRRQREIALRRVLGAGKGRILTQLLIESSMLAVAAGALGLAGAWAGVRVIGSRFAAAVAGPYIPAVDARVLLFSLLITGIAAVLFGLVPALQSLEVDLAGTMKEGGRGVSGSARRKLLSRSLVVIEIAMSMVMLAGAGMMVQGFAAFRDADPGFDEDNLLTAQLTLPVEGARERVDLMAEITDAARAIPGVVAATQTSSLPMNAFATTSAFAISGRPVARDEARPSTFSAAVDGGYLDALGIPLVRGRFFGLADRGDSGPVAVINETLARIHFPQEDPIGSRLLFRDREWEIVGIVGDTRQSLIGTDIAAPAAAPAIFLPLAQTTPGSVFLMARTATEPETASAPLRQGLEAVHSRLVVGRIQTLQDIVEQITVGIDLMSEVVGGFGYLALFLAALGTYGVLAYNVAQRHHEIGIRIAVGAQRREVVKMIVRQGAWLGAIGLAIGAPVVFMIVRVLRFAMQGLGTVELDGVAVVAAVLLATTLLASLLPALRASRLDPVNALRDG